MVPDAPTPNWRDTMQICRHHGGRSDCVLGHHHKGDCWDLAEWNRHTPEERVAHCDGKDPRA